MTGTFEVFIPTWRRTDKLIKTLANSPELQKTATIVVRPEEENHYLDAGFNIMVLPEGIRRSRGCSTVYHDEYYRRLCLDAG
jgi:hypothetical protein